MSDDNTPLRIEVFQVGTHQGDNGKTYDYPPEKVDQAIANFDPKKFRPPLIVTPAMNHDHRPYGDRDLAISPLAHGVPSRLERIGDRVFAEFEKHTPHFAEWLKQGRIPGISAAFYSENDPRNPNPGEATFRHFAGVLFPSIKGMELPGFSELVAAGAELLSEDFAAAFAEDESGIIIDSLYRLRDWLIENKGRDEAEAVLPLQQLRGALELMQAEDRNQKSMLDQIWAAISDLAMRTSRLELMEAEDEDESEFAEPVPPQTLEENVMSQPDSITPQPEVDAAAFAEVQAELEALRSANAELQSQLERLAVEKTRAEVAAFCEPLPADLKAPLSVGESVLDLAQFAESLSADGREFLKAWLPKIQVAIAQTETQPTPQPVSPAMFSEVSADAGESLLGTPDELANFAEYDPESIAYEQRVRAYAKEHQLTYAIAAQTLRGR